MSGAVALRMARDAGLHLRVEGEHLLLKAAAPPPERVLDVLRRHKAEVIALLQCDPEPWSAEDWCAYFDERAGIAEYDGGLTRAEAENLALEACIAEWTDRHQATSDVDAPLAGDQTVCPSLGLSARADDRAAPYRAPLTSKQDDRRAEANAALEAMGVPTRHTGHDDTTNLL